tara:strand:+ start:94 stop:210 length:117 start_codon:yes stop_codon:yes gene_type:complete
MITTALKELLGDVISKGVSSFSLEHEKIRIEIIEKVNF